MILIACWSGLLGLSAFKFSRWCSELGWLGLETGYSKSATSTGSFTSQKNKGTDGPWFWDDCGRSDRAIRRLLLGALVDLTGKFCSETFISQKAR